MSQNHVFSQDSEATRSTIGDDDDSPLKRFKNEQSQQKFISKQQKSHDAKEVYAEKHEDAAKALGKVYRNKAFMNGTTTDQEEASLMASTTAKREHELPPRPSNMSDVNYRLSMIATETSKKYSAGSKPSPYSYANPQPEGSVAKKAPAKAAPKTNQKEESKKQATVSKKKPKKKATKHNKRRKEDTDEEMWLFDEDMEMANDSPVPIERNRTRPNRRKAGATKPDYTKGLQDEPTTPMDNTNSITYNVPNVSVSFDTSMSLDASMNASMDEDED